MAWPMSVAEESRNLENLSVLPSLNSMEGSCDGDYRKVGVERAEERPDIDHRRRFRDRPTGAMDLP